MNGAGNDFILLDNRAGELDLPRDRIALLCDRHRGIGADGVLAVEPPRDGAEFRMRYYNSDGGEAEMCGNGARCFARFARRISGTSGDTIRFETQAGGIQAHLLADGRVRLAMSEPHSLRENIQLATAHGDFLATFVNTGVPHAVIAVENLDALDVRAAGAAIRYHEAFAPAGTNVNFLSTDADGQPAVRTYERGVEGETLACGTGVCAAAITRNLLTGAPPPIGIRVRGGDVLEVGFTRRVDGSFAGVTLTGPADFVFEGIISLE